MAESRKPTPRPASIASPHAPRPGKPAPKQAPPPAPQPQIPDDISEGAGETREQPATSSGAFNRAWQETVHTIAVDMLGGICEALRDSLDMDANQLRDVLAQVMDSLDTDDGPHEAA